MPELQENAREAGLIRGSGRSPGVGSGNLLQYSCLGNPVDKRSLVGFSPRGHKELDTTERLSTHTYHCAQASEVHSPCSKPLDSSLVLLLLCWALSPKWGTREKNLKNYMGFPGGSEGKASACNAGDLGSIPGLGRYPGEGNGNPLQYSCLENPMDGEAW